MCPENLWNFLNDRPGEDFDSFLLESDCPGRKKLWEEFGDEVLRNWILSKPGTRPHFWWEFVFFKDDAPRNFFDKKKVPHLSKQPRFLANRGLLTKAEMKIVGAWLPVR